MLETGCPAEGENVGDGQRPLDLQHCEFDSTINEASADSAVRITMDLLADKFNQRHGETGGLTWSMTANLIQDYADRIDHRV
jgi:hypothetical protein